MVKKHFDLIIIGAGPAGLTAGIYACRANLKTAIFEKYVIGGQLLYIQSIENYPGFENISGYELANKLKSQAEKFGLEIFFEEVKEISSNENAFFVRTVDSTYSSYSIIVATGMGSKKLDISGEEKYIGRGVSYCVICDAPLYRGKKVAYIGKGKYAIVDIKTLAEYANKVYYIPYDEHFEETFSEQNVELMKGFKVVEILGDEFVKGLKLISSTGNEINLSVDGIFVKIGFQPQTDFIRERVKINNEGYVITDESMETSYRGIFACGDCREKKLRQIITACSDGAIAAISAKRYISSIK